jgi:hypothetical protein
VTVWSGTVEVSYGTVVLADAVAGAEPADDVDTARLVEERCATLEAGLQVLVPERDARVPTIVRVVAQPGEIEAEWDHVAETSLQIPSGRAQVYSWMVEEDLAGELDLPTEPLRARIHWGGLERWLHEPHRPVDEGPGAVHLRIDLFPGRAAEVGRVQTLRTWHFWVPPVHESTTADGLRRFRGLAAAPLRAGLTLIERRFWFPYPTTEEGSVQALWRDPETASRWASGTGRTGHPFLQELTEDEADALDAQGFPPVRTYARDADGRIWSADLLPLERAPALLLIPPERWAMFQGLFTGDEVQVVDLPAGWSRITRRPLGGAGSPVLVGAPDGDGSDALYQRWPDGAEIPT